MTTVFSWSQENEGGAPSVVRRLAAPKPTGDDPPTYVRGGEVIINRALRRANGYTNRGAWRNPPKWEEPT